MSSNLNDDDDDDERCQNATKAVSLESPTKAEKDGR